MKRVMDAGGAWTWNVPRIANRPIRRNRRKGRAANYDVWYTLPKKHLDFMREVADSLDEYVIPE